MGRVRRTWTAEEHTLLGNAVSKAQEDGRPLNWHEIAAGVPGRTNKDCRKRWVGKTASTVKKGPWSAVEDERLLNAVKQYGTRWSVVAPEVRTRTGDQCSKRWSYTVNPDIDRSGWTPKEDQLLLDGVTQHGRNWQQIKSIYFPRRTSLGAKNRYHLLRRRSDGARSYSDSPFAQVSDTVSTTVHELEESFGTDQSDSSDSEDEIDKDILEEYDDISAKLSAPEDQVSSLGLGVGKGVQPDSRALKAKFSNSLSSESPDLAPASGFYSKMTNSDKATTQCTPFSNLDFLNYTNATPYTKRMQPPFRQSDAVAPLPPTTRSTFRENASNTTQDIDDLTMSFSPDSRASFTWEDQALFEASMLFPNEPRMLGLGPLVATNNTPTESSAVAVPFSSEMVATVPPVATPATVTAVSQPSLSLAECQRSHSHSAASGSSASVRPLAGDKNRSDDNTRRITIEAVCCKDDLGTVVQAVTDLCLSAVFKTYD